MAKQYVSYDEYLKRAREKAQAEQDAFVADREMQASIKTRGLIKDGAAYREQVKKETDTRIADVQNAYGALYDENAVREKAAQLQVEETLANMGLTDSGLNRTQQTALAATRARADAIVNQKKRAAIEALQNEMNAAMDKNREDIRREHSAERKDALADEEKNRQALEKEAVEEAKTRFAADLKVAEQQYAQEMQDKKFLQEVKRWQAENERQNKKLQADIALQKQKQQDAAALQRQKQSDASVLKKETAAKAGTLTAAQKSALAESLRKAINDRAAVYNEALRRHYDDLIRYYEAQLY